MHTTSLLRPRLLARTYRPVIAFGALAVAVFVGGALVGTTLDNAPRVERIAVPVVSPVTVSVPPAPPPTVTVNVPAPAPPEPVARPSEPAALPSPRPLAPRLWAACVLPAGDQPARICSWDDGFPALAGDGSLIAIKYVPDDVGRGYPGLSLRFIDASSAKVVRTIDLLSPDEYIEGSADNAAELARLHAKIEDRVADAQRALDDDRYRTMTYLGGDGATDRVDPPGPMPTAVYAEVEGGAARLIDPTTRTVISQHLFGEARGTPANDDDFCPGWNLVTMHLWWDPATRIVLSSQVYRTGGCMCPDESVEQVRRVP